MHRNHRVPVSSESYWVPDTGSLGLARCGFPRVPCPCDSERDREQQAHVKWASTLVEQQRQLGAHVTTLTNEYEALLKNVNTMIDVSNTRTRDINELFR